MSIVGGSIAHAEAFAAIHAECFCAAERWPATSIAATLAMPGSFGLIEPSGAMLLARIAGTEGEILTLGVRPERRGRGLARGLIAAAHARAARDGAAAMFLEVAETNGSALALYAACGFVPVGRRKAYYPDGTDAVLLRAELVDRISLGGSGSS